MNPDAALSYLDFVVERHRVWEARQRGEPPPWTDDPIIARLKFTNVFRILDVGSQYVLQLGDDAPTARDALARCFLYRHTNLPKAWDEVKGWWDHWPLAHEMDDRLVRFWEHYQTTYPLFSRAYSIYPQTHEKGQGSKIANIIALTQRFLDVVPTFFAATTQRDKFNVLRGVRGLGDFMAMQILTDYGYTSWCGADRENEFVVLGPGARRGAAIIGCDITWAWQALHDYPRSPTLSLPNGGVRHPSLMDVQNTLCEFFKYDRGLGRSRSTGYVPAHPGKQEPPQLPSHWSRA